MRRAATVGRPAQLRAGLRTGRTGTRRVNGTTITRTLQDEDAGQLRSYLDARRRLRQLTTELEAVSAQVAEQSLTTQRQAEAPGNQRRQTGI